MTYSNIDEFGPGATTCGGDVGTGCSVCTAANLLLAYGKPIPRLTNGTPDMRTLGTRMGARCRAFDGCNHGLSLTSTSHCIDGTWCAKCIHLELVHAGLPARYVKLSFPDMLAIAARRHPMALRGWYGYIPYVSPASYDRNTPARGRSDAWFVGAHMVTWWGSDGHGRQAVSDPDFGSPSRPVVPPFSSWDTDDLRRYWTTLSSSVCVVDTVPTHASGPQSGPNQPAVWRDQMIAPAWGTTGTHKMRLAKGQRAYAAPASNAKVITKMSAAFSVDVVGRPVPSVAWVAVVIHTGAPYKDKATRPTVLYVPRSAGVIT